MLVPVLVLVGRRTTALKIDKLVLLATANAIHGAKETLTLIVNIVGKQFLFHSLITKISLHFGLNQNPALSVSTMILKLGQLYRFIVKIN